MSQKYCNIGGQALIEGVMMKGKSTIAMSVRKPDGEIETEVRDTSSLLQHPLLKLPILRGMVALIEAMVIGTQALTYSAEFFIEDEEEKSGFEKWVEKTFGDKSENILIGISVLTAFAMAILFFTVLPAFLTSLLKQLIKHPLLLSFIEGIIRLALFIGYIIAISKIKEIKRVFEYHGAEHKTIHCYESGKPLTPENAIQFTRIHPRCGTSFMLFVMIISIVIFSFISWESVLMRIGIKLLLLPVVAGISYEVLKFSAKYDNPIINAFSVPGLLMQRITTNEPNLKQLEVAIKAMETVLLKEGEPLCRQ